MTQTQFVEQEVKNYIKFLLPELTEHQLEEKLKDTEYFFNEVRNKITLEIKLENKYQGITLGWSDTVGIYGLEVEE